MIKTILSATALAAMLASGSIPAVAQTYLEWSTNHPFSGFRGGYTRSGSYCDYIRYPIRKCGPHRVCRRGKCRTERSCRVVGWDTRQSCS